MRKDYRHFRARSTAKIGPAKRHQSAHHRVVAKTDLRAEHRSSIEGVMVGASDEVLSLL